jgi:hypothetical protein
MVTWGYRIIALTIFIASVLVDLITGIILLVICILTIVITVWNTLFVSNLTEESSDVLNLSLHFIHFPLKTLNFLTEFSFSLILSPLDVVLGISNNLIDSALPSLRMVTD